MDIEEFERNKCHTESVSVTLEAMLVMENRIRGVYDGHGSTALKTFRRYGHGQHVGRITVKIHQKHVSDNGDDSSLIVGPPMKNCELTMPEGVSVLIVDGQHRFEAIVELDNDTRPMFDWSKIHYRCIFPFLQMTAHCFAWTL